MSDDLIRRTDAIEAIEEVDWWHQNRYGTMVSGANDDEHQAWYKAEDVYKALEAVPSADRPQGEWIPCSERLPEIGQKVLASTKKTVFTQVFKGYYLEPKRWAWENNSVKTIEAWMLLPKPWEGADDEDV